MSLPELQMHTLAAWLSLNAEVFEGLPFGRAQLADGLLGVVRVLHRVAAFRMMCSDGDIGYAVGDGSAEWYSVTSGGEAAGYTFDRDGEGPGPMTPMIFLL